MQCNMNVAERADRVIQNLIKNEESVNKIVKTNQLRKILTLMNNIDAKLKRDGNEKLTEGLEDMLVDLKIKIAYQSGRERKVKEFIKESKLDKEVDDILKTKDVKKLKKLITYTEALVSYHKFHGGKNE